jgi:hypothetical protein
MNILKSYGWYLILLPAAYCGWRALLLGAAWRDAWNRKYRGKPEPPISIFNNKNSK